MGNTPRTHALLSTHRPCHITPSQTILQLSYQVSVDSTLYFMFVMFHVKRCAFPAFPQQIIKSCDVIIPTFSFSTVPLRDPSTTSSNPSPPSSSLLRHLEPGMFTSPVFHVKHQPHPATSRGEAIHFNPCLLRLNYPAVFHVKPLPHCAPTKPMFHVKHRTPLYDAHSNPPRFT